MTLQQKRPCKSKAKEDLPEGKYTSQGTPILFIDREEERKRDYECLMNNYIEATVSTLQHKDSLMDRKFYFVHVNWLCYTVLPNNVRDYIPIEFAVAEFSLRHGVQNTYHDIIDVDVPMGEAYDAYSHAKVTHKIKIHETAGRQKNFRFMFENLKAFLQPGIEGDQLPPLYTTKGIAEIVPGLLSRMAASVDESVDQFRIYSIETLFFHIRNASAALADGEKAKNGFPELYLAYAEISKDRFDQTLGIVCEYHAEKHEASIHCSRSIVSRWAFIICDYCCLDLGIEMLPGKHRPPNRDFDASGISREMRIPNALEFEEERGLASMTGVTEQHRQRVSERTYIEDQQQRLNSRPLGQITD